MFGYAAWSLSRPAPHRHLPRLATTTITFLLLTFLPELLLMSGGPALALPEGSGRVVRLEIEGMGCEACQTHVKALLDRSAAVVASTVNFSQGSAQVWVQEGWGNSHFNLTEIKAQLAYDGYEVTLSTEEVEGSELANNVATVDGSPNIGEAGGARETLRGATVATQGGRGGEL
jgi:hypothetical protein